MYLPQNMNQESGLVVLYYGDSEPDATIAFSQLSLTNFVEQCLL